MSEIGECRRRQRVDGRPAAVRALPVTGRCDHHTGHHILRNRRKSLEDAAIIEDADRRTGGDAAKIGVARMEDNGLFFTGLS